MREVHGAIYEEYEHLRFERSCLELPISDDEAALPRAQLALRARDDPLSGQPRTRE